MTDGVTHPIIAPMATKTTPSPAGSPVATHSQSISSGTEISEITR